MKNLNPSRMRLKLEFGKDVANGKRNPNTGKSMKGYATQFTRRAGEYTLTESQAVSLAGQGIKDAMVFFVRHEPKMRITSDYKVRFDGQLYTIDNVRYDDGLSTNGFDLITCHKEVKHD